MIEAVKTRLIVVVGGDVLWRRKCDRNTWSRRLSSMDELKWNFISVQKRVCMLCKRGIDPHPRSSTRYWPKGRWLVVLFSSSNILHLFLDFAIAVVEEILTIENDEKMGWAERAVTPRVVVMPHFYRDRENILFIWRSTPIYSITASHVLIFWWGKIHEASPYIYTTSGVVLKKNM